MATSTATTETKSKFGVPITGATGSLGSSLVDFLIGNKITIKKILSMENLKI